MIGIGREQTSKSDSTGFYCRMNDTPAAQHCPIRLQLQLQHARIELALQLSLRKNDAACTGQRIRLGLRDLEVEAFFRTFRLERNLLHTGSGLSDPDSDFCDASACLCLQTGSLIEECLQLIDGSLSLLHIQRQALRLGLVAFFGLSRLLRHLIIRK